MIDTLESRLRRVKYSLTADNIADFPPHAEETLEFAIDALRNGSRLAAALRRAVETGALTLPNDLDLDLDLFENTVLRGGEHGAR